MKKLIYAFCSIFLFGITFLLNGCQAVLLEPKGMVGAEQEKLILISLLLMLIVVIPVILLTIIFSWRYRASNEKARYTPNWSHNVALEFIWWLIPCVIVFILCVIAWVTSHSLDPYKPLRVEGEPLTVEVVSLDWKWLFIYPKQNIATINYLQIPENTPVEFKITSQGPMNALWIPQLGGQVYAMAGMQTKLHLIANHEGVYKGMSANFSGPGFTNMFFKVHVTSEKAFRDWALSVKRGNTSKLDMNMYQDLAKPSEDVPVQYFSSVQKGLFNSVKMTFMMPNMTHGMEQARQ